MIRVLKALVKRVLDGPHECEECKYVMPSHRARFHAQYGATVLTGVPKYKARTLESDLLEDR